MRVKWIDSAKEIAILLVIIGHASLGRTGLFNIVYGIQLELIKYLCKIAWMCYYKNVKLY